MNYAKLAISAFSQRLKIKFESFCSATTLVVRINCTACSVMGVIAIGNRIILYVKRCPVEYNGMHGSFIQ